jgi:dihydrofolate synthase/folylpolyglutamate synthase
VVAQTLAQWRRDDRADRPLHLIFAMLNSKDPAGFIKPFRGLEPRIKAIAIPDEPASLSAADVLSAATGAGLRAAPAEGVEQALRAIAEECGGTGTPPRVLICGTLYLAGHVLALNGTPPT